MDINELIVLAEQGDIQAIADLACEYLNGEPVEQDLKKGAALMERAAQAGHALAALNMSYIYRDGDGVAQNFQKAEEWALRAAELGESDELVNIARCYIVGKRLEDNPYETDYNKAFEYFHFLVVHNLGNPDSIAYLGNCYEYGWGTQKDQIKAEILYRKAAEAGSDIGFEAFANISNRLKSDFVRENIDLIKHFSNKNALAQNLLADAYYFGYGVHESDRLSYEWREKAALNGNAESQCTVAEWYANGINGKSVDKDKALTLWCAAAEQGHRLAKLCAAHQLIEHTYSPQDQAKAITYYTEVAELGLNSKHQIFTDAQLFLGSCYLEGKGVPQNLALAEKWLSAAANNGSETAQKLLTKIYLTFRNN